MLLRSIITETTIEDMIKDDGKTAKFKKMIDEMLFQKRIFAETTKKPHVF